ncbi:molybdate transport system substrate-binding protein [Orenia metallireducens]|jgi:molybdate transport system substrate-binding protein|uniref:Molybdate transport system substrate-binding protein n=1 Tax=Orenia metallireducens TaxID=1413210 RepID=A0A285IG32_9FIRM|nr:molybdate ABC transporter substrate-binding protein [Orenia metallireducens]PRX19659.1 molybdate transport system substrate-binding protein [Orenia metallireducens]SNY46046.1 molybdate transport system substrate-binding protein [Orenia metallireducens]
MKRLIISVLLLVMMIMAGCQGSETTSSSEPVTIRVMAAASLTEVFNDLKAAFEEKYDDVKLEINYAGSQALYSQIKSGVSADIFASANIKYMNQLDQADMVADPTIFARNKLVIVASKESAVEINGIKDLLQNGISLVIADKSVPVGRYTVQMLEKQSRNPQLPSDYQEKFLAAIVSKELDVKSVLAKVELGEADAGVVYQTDANASNQDKVKVVDIKDQYNVIATYPISPLKDISSAHQAAAAKFLDYLYSDKGGDILEGRGFIKVSRD